MKSATFPAFLVLFLFTRTSLCSTPEADRDKQLQGAFEHFPILAQATEADGRPAFQKVAAQAPVVVNGENYYGFRFIVPRRKHHEDFVWAFVEPDWDVEWYILPQAGTMEGFDAFSHGSKGDYMGTNQLFPLNIHRLIFQSLSGTSLKDGDAYLIWWTYVGKAKPVSVAFTYAPLAPKEMNKVQPIEKILGLTNQLSEPIVNPFNNHIYRILRAATWKKSEAEAVALGGHLATIRNQAENDWLFKTFGSYGGCQRLLWTGLSDRDKKFHFTWSSGESVSFTAWARGEPNNAGRGEDFVAMYYPNHSQHGKWNDWSDRTFDPTELPINGVVEIIPPESHPELGHPSAGAAATNLVDTAQTVTIAPAIVITSEGGKIKLQWPASLSGYMLEATTNLSLPFKMFGYSELTNSENGLIYVTITNPEPQMFFRLRMP